MAQKGKKRYINTFATSKTPEQISAVMGEFCRAEDFDFVNFEGEWVYKKGGGWATAPQLISIAVNGNLVTVSAWLKVVFLPGVYMGDMGLDGVYGFAIKDVLAKRVARLEEALR